MLCLFNTQGPQETCAILKIRFVIHYTVYVMKLHIDRILGHENIEDVQYYEDASKIRKVVLNTEGTKERCLCS